MTYNEIKAKAEEIFPTLTTSYYTGNGSIKAALSNTAPTSYFDLTNRTITVSLSNVIKATARKITGRAASELDIERSIREELYHELSHAILTPANIGGAYGGWFSRKYWATSDTEERKKLITQNDLNIYEDERIETLFARFFMRCNFKESIKALCPYRPATTLEEYIFFAVRHRRAVYKQAEASALVDSFVAATKNISAYKGDPERLLDEAQKLHNALRELWEEYAITQQQQPQQQPQNGGGNAEDAEGEESAQNSGGNGQREQGKAEAEEGNENAENETQQSKPETEEAEGNEEQTEEAEETEGKPGQGNPETEEGEPAANVPNVKEARDLAAAAVGGMETAADDYDNTHGIKKCHMDKRAYIDILKILTRVLGTGNAAAPVTYGYSGKLSARRMIKDVNEELKWWRKRSFADTAKANKGQKKTLNIWLDQSGSFGGHDANVNGILRALVELEEKRSDFEWNLIRIDGNTTLVKNKNDRYSISGGGTRLLANQINAAYRETHAKNLESTFDIVLFDGEVAYPKSVLASCSEEQVKRCVAHGEVFDPLAVFNNKRSVFITEQANIEGIRETCPNAREIIEENTDYEGKLLDNIVKALAALF